MSKINARKKGNQFETDLAVELRGFFPDVVTSRSESKRTDDKGVDFCYTAPFNIQAKAWERAPSYHTILAQMPDWDGHMNVIFHKKNHKGTVVIMTKETFFELVQSQISEEFWGLEHQKRCKEIEDLKKRYEKWTQE